MRSILLVLATGCVANAGGLGEVNYWRTRNGLPPFTEDRQLTAFAQYKAEYRAARLLKDGHQGPRCPAGCREGTGEAHAHWGWLTCVMDETGHSAGAGVAIGADGERYMVLVVRGNGGNAMGGRQLQPLPTAHLTPNAPRIPWIRR